ncbi:glycolate oxidase subunit GlcE [Variovorax rhizosphaerae]|uniref:Glycolate oxidase subunit GlcE n=1 Tax=Variovorax rhizosphaerae TaxID=1836200 RepID=A0ABU8WF03_9BURK
MDTTLQAMVERVRAAAASATPLCIRGGSTKDFYGEPIAGEALDTTPLAGIVSYEPSELVVTVRTGTPLAELEALLAGKGQCLAFEPPRFGGGTVGGMVAAGLSGPSRASVGSVRDHVLGAELLNGKAELLRFGGTVMKNVAGYDVSRVLAGSLGTLGVITEVSLKVLPVPPAEATLRFDCSQADALRLLNSWGGQPLPLNASCWVEDAGNPVLYLRLRGAVAAVEAACAHLGGERQENVAADWDACRDQTLPWFVDTPATHDLWRVSVPQTAPVLAIAGEPPLIEWHGAQRWYRIPSGQGGAIRAAARAAGGHATLFRPGDASRSDARFDTLSPALARVQHNLMHEFDPHRIFNRGRLGNEGKAW